MSLPHREIRESAPDVVYDGCTVVGKWHIYVAYLRAGSTRQKNHTISAELLMSISFFSFIYIIHTETDK